MGVAIVSAEALGQAVGADGTLSLLDKKLLKWASQGLTPLEISERLDGILSPAQSAQRVREILRASDWLSVVERRALVLQDMIEVKEILMARIRAEGGMVEGSDGTLVHSFGDPRWSSNVIKLLGEMNKLISSEQQNIDLERQGLRRAHAMVMVRATEMAFDMLSREIRKSYPQVEPKAMRLMLEEAVPIAITAIDEAILDEDRLDDEGGF